MKPFILVKPFYFPALVSLIAIIFFYLPESWQFDLQYRSQQISEGQFWRLLTGHFLHTNLYHLLVNLAGLWGICLIYSDQMSLKRGLIHFGLICVLSALLLWFFCQQVDWYVGLSGGLHGFLVWVALNDWRKHPIVNSLLLIGLAGKLVYEFVMGDTTLAREIEANVVVEMHWFGVVGGVGLFCCNLATTLARSGNKTKGV